MKVTSLKYLFLALSLSIGTQVFSQQLAFPGAEGFGRFTTGGRGGVVYYVTSLDDCSDSDLKPGTLRWALHTNSDDATPRTILFKVGGTIHLTSQLKTNCSNVSILGQSAPGGGICIADYKVYVNKPNTIVRYLRFRSGDLNASSVSSLDVENCKHVIIDHCSFSWSIEENITMYDNDSTTLQWCISSEPLYNSYNKKGARAYGAQWGGEYSTFHHNLFAHCNSRIPQVYGVTNTGAPADHDTYVEEEILNNVMFNCGGSEASYNGRVLSTIPGAYCHVNLVGNYYKPGPMTYKRSASSNRFFCTIYNNADTVSTDDLSRWYVYDNKYEVNEFTGSSLDLSLINADNWYGAKKGSKMGVNFKYTINGDASDYKLSAPSVNSGVETQAVDESYLEVVSKAGAQWPSLDEIDARILAEAAGLQAPQFAGSTVPTWTGLIDSQQNLKPEGVDSTWSAWPDMTNFPDEVVPADTDADGMPDSWEDANGFNKNDASDGPAIASNGYSNLENYLNSVIEGIKAPSNITASYNSDNAALISWIDNSDSETGFRLERADITSAADTVFATIADLSADVTEYVDASALKSDKYIYRLSALSASGSYSNAVRTVLYPVSDATAVFEPSASGVDGLQVSPVKVKDFLNVRGSEALASVFVVDLSGRTVLSVDAESQSVLDLNLGSLTAGLYVVKIVALSGNASSQKIIKE